MKWNIRGKGLLALLAVAAACGMPGWTAFAVGQEPPAAVEEVETSPPTEPAEGVTQRTTSLWAELDLTGLWTENSWKEWSVLLGAILAGMVVGWIVAAVLASVGKRLQDRGWRVGSLTVEGAIGPAKLAVLALGLAVGIAAIKGMSDPLLAFWGKTLLLIYSIAVFWYAFNLVSVIDAMLRSLTARTESDLDDQLVPVIRKGLRVFLVVIGIMFVVDSVFNQDIGAWLAGLGIAGLAVSLAAQDSLKNLFGSVTILFDRPFQVGERINCSGYDGVVEEIGFRSTKVRTLTGHMVTIPNSNIVNDPVENIAKRKSIRRTMNVTITYDTPREKIDQAVQILRDILEENDLREPIHATIDGDEFPPRVYFNDFNAESLNILVIYWHAPPAYWDYLDHAQRLNLRIFEEFERAGIEFAFPTQTLYLAGDPKRELVVQMLGKEM